MYYHSRVSQLWSGAVACDYMQADPSSPPQLQQNFRPFLPPHLLPPHNTTSHLLNSQDPRPALSPRAIRRNRNTLITQALLKRIRVGKDPICRVFLPLNPGLLLGLEDCICTGN